MPHKLIVLCCLLTPTIASLLPYSRDKGFPIERIVNGEETSIEEHPYQVSIQRIGGSHFCGGSIISPDIVVTAAHCMVKVTASNIQVRVGSKEHDQGGEVIYVQNIRNHEKFVDQTKMYDISVIRLSRPIHETAKVHPIDLATESPRTGTPAVVIGWGATCFKICSSSLTLQKVAVEIVGKSDCASEQYNHGSQMIVDNMLCAYAENKDACQGDSGGPLVAGNKLVGVVSWGIGCAESKYPGVYADVALLREWILKTSEEL